MKLKRGEIHKLLPQTHSPGVDYSLFIMETVEKSLEKMKTTPAAPRRSFPPPIYNSRSLFRGFCVSAALLSEGHRGLFLLSVLGQNLVSGEKIDGSGATRAKLVGPTRPLYLAAWFTLFWASGLRLFACFAPKSSSFQILTLLNLQVIWTSFGSLKH